MRPQLLIDLLLAPHKEATTVSSFTPPSAAEVCSVRRTIDDFYVDQLHIRPAEHLLPAENITKLEDFHSPGFTGDIYFCVWPSGPNSMEVVLHTIERGWWVYHSISGADPAYICGELFNPED